MDRCGTCQWWVSSTTYTNIKNTHRRLCPKIGKFTPPDHYCSKYTQALNKVYCPVLKKIVRADEYCVKVKLTECKQCRYRDLFLNIESKGLLKRHKRADFQLRINYGGDGDMVDGRILLKHAIDALNMSGLTSEKIDTKNIPAMPINELRQVINKFFDLVESIPPNKEDLIPNEVIVVYNKLVDGELVFLNDEIDGKKVIASNGMFYFKRAV